MAETKAERKSALTAALEARPRTSHRFDVSGFFGLGEKAIPEVCVRVPTKDEEDKAVIAAHAYAKQRASGDDEARRDPDLLNDAKVREILFRTVFEPTAEPGAVQYPAFSGGPDWMRTHLTSDQMACLFNLLTEVKRAESPLVSALEQETVEAVARACWAARNTDLPEAALANCSREWLTQAFVLLAMRLSDFLGWDKPEPEATSEDVQG